MKKIIIGIIYVIIVATVLSFFAKDSKPGSSLYHIKRLDEKIVLTTKRNPYAKADYYSHLLDLRINEFEDVIYSDLESQILPTSLRYAATAGEFTQHVKVNHLKERTTAIEKQFDSHEKILNKLSAFYKPKTHTDDTGKFILDDINYLNTNRGELPR